MISLQNGWRTCSGSSTSTSDLHGCYDRPPSGGPLRNRVFWLAVLPALRPLFGRRLVYAYNWHFAAKQDRGLKWWWAAAARGGHTSSKKPHVHAGLRA